MLNKFYYFFFLLFFLSFNSNTQAQEKIVFVDINYIFNKSTAGKSVNKQINDKNQKLSTDLKKYQKNIDTQKEKIIKQKNVISKEEYKNKILALEKEIQEYKKAINKKKIDLSNYKIKVRIEFTKLLQPILETYSKDNLISMILDKKEVLIGKTSLDSTKEILDLFNKNVKKIAVK